MLRISRFNESERSKPIQTRLMSGFLLIAGPAYLIPIVEFAVGILLILGLQTRKALIANFLLMMTLSF